MKRLSDLEMAILGIVRKRSPCTAYAVAREFSASPSSHWRGSVGAVYPAVARLRRLGLLRQERAARLGRACGLLALSPRGLAALRRWLTPPLPAAAAALTFDPLRTRAYFLAVLAPAEQSAFLEAAERELRAQAPLLKAEVARYRRSGDWFSEHAQRGALHVLKGRLAWIREFRRAFKRRLAVADPGKERAS